VSDNIEKQMKFVMDSKFFPNCIECSEHYLEEELRCFFHKVGCTRGRSNWKQTSKRLDERWEVFKQRHGEDGSSIECAEPGCTNKATGMLHILYHSGSATVEKWPVCMDHAFHDAPNGREAQYRGF